MVRARQVVIATNGYSTERLHSALNGRLIPVLSNIIVTRPMAEHEQEESRLVTTDVMMDTRKTPRTTMLDMARLLCEKPKHAVTYRGLDSL